MTVKKPSAPTVLWMTGIIASVLPALDRLASIPQAGKERKIALSRLLVASDLGIT
jgi:hypothetical protein